jgi:type II secretory pathway pseudopilin PulG
VKFNQRKLRSVLQRIAAMSVIILIASAALAQTRPVPMPNQPANTPAKPVIGPNPFLQEMNQYPGLQQELGLLFEKIRAGVQLPVDRTQSLLLPVLPESTLFYAALPNYGEPSHQALKIFEQELQQSPVLRDWWQHGSMAASGPKLEEALERFYQLSQYLGDEVVVSGGREGPQDPSVLLIAQLRKPGLKQFLTQAVRDLGGPSSPALRIIDVNELASAKELSPSKGLVIVLRPDYVMAGTNLSTLRKVNARLERKGADFAATPFGQRVTQAYDGGLSTVGAVDLHGVLGMLPRSTEQNEKIFQRSGFSDLQYLVWEHKDVAGQATSEVELSFAGPRRGIAGWLAAPGPLNSLDFVSPDATMAGAVLLNNPARIYDEVQELSTLSKPTAFAAIAQVEQGLNVSFRNDLIQRLQGEIAFEVDKRTENGPAESSAAWKVILRVDDAARTQAVLGKLLAMAPVRPQYSEEDGIGYHTFQIPNPQKTVEVAYAFVDGYLIIASSREKIAEAARLYRSGQSLAKSPKLTSQLPAGNLSEVSGLFYEDPTAVMALSMLRALPGFPAALTQRTVASPPVVLCAYGEPSALREVSKSAGADAGAMMIVAAIAIPNLIRARTAANDSTAVSTIRIANTAQIAYATSFPDLGYARDFARLGPDPAGSKQPTASHADLIDSALGNAGCTAGTWCAKAGYRFSLKAVCIAERCGEYVVVATPESSGTGTRSFCSTSDAVVRFRIGEPLPSPVSVRECRSWPALR